MSPYGYLELVDATGGVSISVCWLFLCSVASTDLVSQKVAPEIEAITRQWMRLGLHLELSQLLGIFYSHIGFYMNQALVNRATKAEI